MTLPVISRLIAVRIAALAVAMLTASTAAAQYSYGVLGSTGNGDANWGASVWIQTDVLATQTCSNHVNHEMWYDTVSSGPYWVEVGFKAGDPGASNASCVANRNVTSSEFWCDARPNNNSYYNCHFYGYTWSFGYWYVAQITYQNSCNWAVSLGGVTLGTSTSNCPGVGRNLWAGIEHYHPNSETDNGAGFLTNWAESPFNGQWTDTWDNIFVSDINTSGDNLNIYAQDYWGNPCSIGSQGCNYTQELLNE
jgi:hypothetical protein